MESNQGYNPYINNGGTVLAASWKNYAVIAADTRLSAGYTIHTRNSSKLVKLTDKCVLGTSGMQADMLSLHSALTRQIELYRFTHHKDPSITAVVQLLSTILYSKRFFPYYTFNTICGIDEEGNGAVFNFDAIGSFHREPYGAQGTSALILSASLDSQMCGLNFINKPNIQSPEELVNIVKNSLIAAVERDVYTGDSAEVIICDDIVHDPVRMDLRID